MSSTRGQRYVLALAAGLVALVLTACVAQGAPTSAPTTESPITESTVPSPSSSETTAPTSRDPILRPGQSAAANQQFFDFVNANLYAAQGRTGGRAIVDNLVANGFVKADMEVTPDTTAIGNVADSVIVSVRISGECLIGQFGASQYTGIRAPLLGTGSCLVGRTRPIDW